MFTKYTFAITLFASILFAAFSWSYSNKSQPPAARTLAPGEITCTGCHGGTLNTVSGLSFSFGGGQTSYIPGNTYTIIVGVTDATKTIFGFEITALTSANTSSAGTFSVTNTTNTVLVIGVVSGNSRQYVGHKNGTGNNSWSFNWTAPVAGTGTVRFYLAGNAANGNNSSSGDQIYTANYAITETLLPPVASFSPLSASVCAGASVSFSDLSTGGATSWNWSFPGGNPVWSNLKNPVIQYSNPGTFNVQLISANSAGSDTLFVSNAITVNSNPAFTSQNITNVNCFGQSTGAIDITVGSGAPSYAFNWSNGSSSQDLSLVAAGTYNVTVTDSKGCTASSSYTVNQSTQISLSTSSIGANCGNSNGSATVTPTGGTPMPNYTYSWSSGSTLATATGLAAGTYQVTVTDGLGCTASTSVAVSNVGGPVVSAVTTDITCTGNADGEIDVQVTGGSGVFSVSWSHGPAVQDVSGLSAGLYTITVTDTNGCLAVQTFTISEPALLTIAMSSTPDQDSSGSGTATAIPSGGTPPYSYLWNTIPAQTNSIASGLSVGMYSVTVTDSNGCSVTDTVQVQGAVGYDKGNPANSIRVFPNPATDRIYIWHAFSETPKVDIIAMNGLFIRGIQYGLHAGSEIEVDVSGLAPGYYLVRVAWGECRWTAKFHRVP